MNSSLLKPGGVVMVDNVLCDGRVLDADPTNEDTKVSCPQTQASKGGPLAGAHPNDEYCSDTTLLLWPTCPVLPPLPVAPSHRVTM